MGEGPVFSAPPTFERYVALGDSSTEGLEDPDDFGGYRGWADRLALLIAAAQPPPLGPPLAYANLAVRGLRLHEIRATQLAPALAMEPDLVTVFGGVNDVIGPRPHWGQIGADLVAVFGAARSAGATVATFTMPDPLAISPVGRLVRERMFVLNDLIRASALAHDVLVVDFQQFPIAEDPRLWFADRLHGNPLGHQRVAAAMAWRLGIAGADDGWARAFDEEFMRPARREQLASDVDWAVHYLAPWVGKGIRRIPHGRGIAPKRPELTVVDPTDPVLDLRTPAADLADQSKSA
ncbi:MAG: SGNH/GDSL hydrolase family protein [Propionibacteriaceae bacterium]